MYYRQTNQFVSIYAYTDRELSLLSSMLTIYYRQTTQFVSAYDNTDRQTDCQYDNTVSI